MWTGLETATLLAVALESFGTSNTRFHVEITIILWWYFPITFSNNLLLLFHSLPKTSEQSIVFSYHSMPRTTAIHSLVSGRKSCLSAFSPATFPDLLWKTSLWTCNETPINFHFGANFWIAFYTFHMTTQLWYSLISIPTTTKYLDMPEISRPAGSERPYPPKYFLFVLLFWPQTLLGVHLWWLCVMSLSYWIYRYILVELSGRQSL